MAGAVERDDMLKPHRGLKRDEALTDDVWARLDPHAGRLSRRSVLRLWAAGAAAILVLIAGVGVYLTGFVTPRVHADGSSFSMERPVDVSTTTPVVITLHFTLDNRGSSTVAIKSLGGPLAGDVRQLSFVSTWNLPRTLPPATGQEVTVTYRLTSCNAFPTAAELPIGRVPLTVDRWWGTQHLMVPVDAVVPNPCRADI